MNVNHNKTGNGWTEERAPDIYGRNSPASDGSHGPCSLVPSKGPILVQLIYVQAAKRERNDNDSVQKRNNVPVPFPTANIWAATRSKHAAWPLTHQLFRSLCRTKRPYDFLKSVWLRSGLNRAYVPHAMSAERTTVSACAGNFERCKMRAIGREEMRMIWRQRLGAKWGSDSKSGRVMAGPLCFGDCRQARGRYWGQYIYVSLRLRGDGPCKDTRSPWIAQYPMTARRAKYCCVTPARERACSYNPQTFNPLAGLPCTNKSYSGKHPPHFGLLFTLCCQIKDGLKGGQQFKRLKTPVMSLLHYTPIICVIHHDSLSLTSLQRENPSQPSVTLPFLGVAQKHDKVGDSQKPRCGFWHNQTLTGLWAQRFITWTHGIQVVF